MASPQPETPVSPPRADGDIRVFVSAEAVKSGYFNRQRRVMFVNGIQNSGQDHMDSALNLSLMQMCTVVGIYNKTSVDPKGANGPAHGTFVGTALDVWQCGGDKLQFNNSPASVLKSVNARADVATVRSQLSRNACQVAMFDFLRQPENRKMELFAHSQGNLILSNVLEAISMVDGADAVKGWKVNTFGSPSVHWPDGLDIQEYGFTFDLVNVLSGPNVTRAISKVGKPAGTSWYWPVTHGFEWYMKEDPAFTINRFRTGGWGMTFNMDEEGLAKCLVAMGTNMPRVSRIFAYLEENHNSDSDDVAEYYLDEVRTSRPDIARALAGDAELRRRLSHILDTGWTSAGEKRDSDWVKSLP